jgi:hypothetical protein
MRSPATPTLLRRDGIGLGLVGGGQSWTGLWPPPRARPVDESDEERFPELARIRLHLGEPA